MVGKLPHRIGQDLETVIADPQQTARPLHFRPENVFGQAGRNRFLGRGKGDAVHLHAHFGESRDRAPTPEFGVVGVRREDEHARWHFPVDHEIPQTCLVRRCVPGPILRTPRSRGKSGTVGASKT